MVKVRPLKKADFSQVVKMDKVSGNALEQWVSDIDANGYNDYSFGIFTGNKLIGYCSIGYADDCCETIESNPEHKAHDDTYLLSDVFIASEYRGRGYGHKLVKETIESRFQMEEPLPVFLEVMQENLKHFYGKLGFKDIGNLCMVLIP